MLTATPFMMETLSALLMAISRWLPTLSKMPQYARLKPWTPKMLSTLTILAGEDYSDEEFEALLAQH